jgi:hypothetical protein
MHNVANLAKVFLGNPISTNAFDSFFSSITAGRINYYNYFENITSFRGL